jgi:putative Holliday junction resolvase
MSLVIGLDVGTQTIGVARMDPRSGIAAPWFTLARQGVRRDVTRLKQAFGGLDAPVTRVVVGWPLELDGTEGRICRLSRQVGDALGAATGLPVDYHDEQWSSVEAERRLTAAGVGHDRRREVIDQAAAMVILEDWLAHDRQEDSP